MLKQTRQETQLSQKGCARVAIHVGENFCSYIISHSFVINCIFTSVEHSVNKCLRGKENVAVLQTTQGEHQGAASEAPPQHPSGCPFGGYAPGRG